MKKFQKGFTIIELVIYSAIFAMVLGVTVQVFFQTRSLEAEITQDQEVDRNGRVALLEMTQTIRNAASVTSPVLGASGNQLYLNSSAIRYFVSVAGVLQKTESGTTADLTSNGVTVQNLTFTTRGEALNQPTVSISFTLMAKTRVYGQGSNITKSYQTTVQLR